MASLDRDTLVLQVRKEIIETGTASGQWDDTELIQFLQEANERLTDISQLEVSSSAVTVAGTETVAYPATIGKIAGIWSREQNTTQDWVRLRKASLEERFPDTGSNRGAPASYFIFAGKIYLIPIPDKVYSLTVAGYQKASELRTAFGGGGSTTAIFDDEFHPLMKLYAVARAKQKVDDPGYANYDGQYLAGIGAMLTKLEAERNEEGPRMVKITSPMW